MDARVELGMNDVLLWLKATAEPTRLRILALLQQSELTVSDLTAILGQSQPRVSRHLKLLADADIIERFPEGAWVYYRLIDTGPQVDLLSSVLNTIAKHDAQINSDRERLRRIRTTQAESANSYFDSVASTWDEIRSLHVSDAAIDQAMLELVGPREIDAHLDLGTGTGRLLDLFSPYSKRAVGIDASPKMLSVARTNIHEKGQPSVQVRQGDICALTLTPPSGTKGFDLVTIHHVLHFLSDPSEAIGEAARLMAPGGFLLIVDFAPHDLDYLREKHAHRRLGFADDQMAGWFEAKGLTMVKKKHLRTNKSFDGDEKDTSLVVSIWLATKPLHPDVK